MPPKKSTKKTTDPEVVEATGHETIIPRPPESLEFEQVAIETLEERIATLEAMVVRLYGHHYGGIYQGA